MNGSNVAHNNIKPVVFEDCLTTQEYSANSQFNRLTELRSIQYCLAISVHMGPILKYED